MIARSVLPGLVAERGAPYVSVLIGPRQVGKTVLLRMIAEAQASATYLDVENPTDAVAFRGGLTSLVAEVGTAPQVLLIDEFQRLPDALGLFKQLRDAYPQIKVYASGSSGIEIHAHLKQSAVGRVRRTRIFPLSFPEVAAGLVDGDLASWDPLVPLPPRALARLREALDEFLIWGGMPGLLHAPDEMERRRLLDEVVHLYLEKDIRALLAPDHAVRYNEFLRLAALATGGFSNRSAFGRELGLNARQTARHLAIMEHTFVLRLVTTAYANPTKRLVAAPKLYWYDNGVRHALLRDFRPRRQRPDAGALVENHVLAELEKAIGVDQDVLTHRTPDGQEIDFLLERDRRQILIEVKSALTRPRVPPAIVDQLTRPDAVGAVVLNDAHHELVHVHAKPVLFLPLALTHRVPSLWGIWG